MDSSLITVRNSVKKLSITLAGMAIAAMTLSGCTALLPQQKPEPSPAASEEAEPSAEPDAAPSGDGTFDGGVDAAPGSTVAPGVWANIPFLNFDDKTAVLSHHLMGVENAPAAEVDYLVSEIPELKGMEVYFITVETRYVSGDILPFTSPTSFRPIDADGKSAQSLTLIGYDACPTESFSDEEEMPTQVVTNCYAAAAPAGGNIPAGVMWTQYDTDTEDSPILFFVE